MQNDGYGVYESLSREHRRLTVVGCWAHVRRNFHEALNEGRVATWFMGQVGLHYAEGKMLREAKAGSQLRAAVRSGEGRLILDDLRWTMQRSALASLAQESRSVRR